MSDPSASAQGPADTALLFKKPTFRKTCWSDQPGILRSQREQDSYPSYPGMDNSYECGNIRDALKTDTVFFSIDFETLCLEKLWEGGYRTKPITEIGISVLDTRIISGCKIHGECASGTAAEAPGCFPGPTATKPVTPATPATPVKTAAAAEAPGCFPGPTAAVGPLPCRSNPGDRGLIWQQHVSSDHYIVDDYSDHYAGNCRDVASFDHNSNSYGFAFKSSKFVKEVNVAKLIQSR
ncbi:hypothetical protein CTA2_7222 [Colletotrichum tanaceti]|uniref:Uncharacterized protein n=1 Tax=Colletotrichum tanaceti TaxID=1306861 RepID=A0A4U6XMW5_9PEZI|nr:hypothetical protein CTA2_7222 [Colletotrichum tanaceti]TKW57014.1 hypothetical protein CTA1_13025 [Colletotrichum tanaceti]